MIVEESLRVVKEVTSHRAEHDCDIAPIDNHGWSCCRKDEQQFGSVDRLNSAGVSFTFLTRRCFFGASHSLGSNSKAASSTVSVHRSQHSSQVGHCGIDLSRSGRKQVRLSTSAFRFVTPSDRTRYFFQDGYGFGKQSGLLLPLGFIGASKPLDDVVEIYLPSRSCFNSALTSSQDMMHKHR